MTDDVVSLAQQVRLIEARDPDESGIAVLDHPTGFGGVNKKIIIPYGNFTIRNRQIGFHDTATPGSGFLRRQSRHPEASSQAFTYGIAISADQT